MRRSQPLPSALLRPFPPFRPGLTTQDPKPAWTQHQLHDAMKGRLDGVGVGVDLQAWWQAHRADPGAWASAHPVAARIPAMALMGHREALWAHAEHVRRHPSRFSSGANHRVAEVAALALAKACLADLPAPPPLAPVLSRQLHPDGWPREQSVAYLAYILEWGLIAHRCGEDLSQLLHRGATALEATLSAKGHPFAIGDDGGDRVLPGDAPYALDVVGCVRSALGQPAPARWTPGVRAQLLGLGAAPPAASPRGTSFPDGGFTILRSPHLIVGFAHGPVGMEPLAGHGHDDLLAVWAHRDGKPWLVGRGTSAYHDPEVRWQERGPWGTCGLVLDDRMRSLPHTHPFLWQQRSRAHLDQLRLDPRGGQVTAHHEAWPGIRHVRTVTLRDDELTVADRLEGEGVHHVALSWHLAPGLDGSRELARLDSPLPVQVVSSRHAVAYGEVTSATSLVAAGPVALPVTLTSRWS